MRGRRKVQHLVGSMKGKATIDNDHGAVRWHKARPRRIEERPLNYILNIEQWERRKHEPVSWTTGDRSQATGTYEAQAVKEESF